MLMHMNRKWLPVMAIFLGALAFLGLLVMVLAPAAQAQEEPETPTTPIVPADRFISVVGQARVSATPDQATVRLGVVSQSPTATAALTENAALMEAVISATLALVDEDQVRTETVQLYPVYSDVQPLLDEPGSAVQQTEPQITGYRAMNIISVTADDVGLVADVLDAATTAGANTVEGISFEIADRSALLTQARQEAIRDARAKAEVFLEEAGGALGEVLVIREQGTGGLPQTFAQDEVLGRGGAVPVLPGQQFIDVSVEVIWALDGGGEE
jgi:uncharacterized protein YggE